MNINDFLDSVRTEVAGWNVQTGLVVTAAVAAVAVGIVWRLMHLRAKKRLQSVLDRYAERQIATTVQLDPSALRQQILKLNSLRRSGLVMGVRR